MFKGKKWLIGVCSMLLAFGIAACSGSDDDSSSSTPPASVPDSSQSSSETPLDPTVTLSSETLDMDLFAKSTLTASLTDLTGEVVWSTSDASVATVENGVVRAVGVGTATITATVGEYSDSCAVTIVRGEKKPTFDAFSTVNVIVGQTYDLEATLSLDEEDFELATVTYASTGEFLTVTPEGKITGVKEGTQTITATAMYGEETLATAEITVSVIEVGTIETGIDMNVLALMATNYTGESKTEYTLENFVTYVNGIEVEKEISYTVQDNTVVKVEDGKIVALAAGETVVTAEFTSDTNKKYSVDITVSVGKELVAQDVEFSAKGSSETTQNTGATEIDFAGKAMDINVSDITGVKCNDKSIAFTTNGTVLTLTDAPSGEQVYVFETAKVDVQVEGFIYQRTISSKEELVAFGANYNGNYGYTILTADIDMGGDVFALQTGAWLRCTFDGQGHTISNVKTTTGFLGDFNEKGVLKNLQLVNIVLERPATDEKGEIGLLARCACGTIENVLVMGYVANAKENQPLLTGDDYTSTVYKNIIIIASTDQPTLAVSGSGFYYMQGSGATGYGVHYITPQTIQAKPAGAVKLDATAYTTIQEFAEKADLSTFEEPWDSENLLMSEISDNVQQFEVSFKGEIAAGKTITVDTTLFDAVVTIKEETSNAVVSGRNIEIKANGIYTVVVSSASNTGVSKEVELLCLTTEEISTTETYVETSGGNTKMDLSKLSKTVAEVTSMTVNGKAVTPTVNENEVTFANTQTGTIEVSIYSESEAKIYTFTLNVADFIINDAEEFKTFANAMGNYKYVVLANDITMDASVGLQRNGVAFTGTFDGQNYTVRNAFFKYGIFVNNGFAPGGVMKNVKFDNLLITGYGVFGAFLSGGLIENFHATINFKPGYNYNDGWSGYLLQMPTGRGANTFTIKNSTLVFNGSDKTKKLKLYSDDNYYPTILENVNILVNGLVAKPGEEDFNGKVQTSVTQTAGWVNVTIKDSRENDTIVPTVADEKWTLDLTTLGLTGKTISVVKDQIGNSVEFTQSGDILTFTYEKQVALLLTLIASDDTKGVAFVNLPYYAMADSATETTYDVEYVKATAGALSIDLSKVGVEIKDLNRVLINNEKATYTVEGTMINVTGYAGAFGELKVHLRAGEAWYVFDVIIADCVITNAEEFAAWANNQGGAKYAVLANDVTMDANQQLQSKTKFEGVFNGLNHKVANPGFFYSIFAGKAASTAVLKNVTFDKVMIKAWGLFGPSTQLPLIDNVHITVVYASNFVVNDGWNKLLVQTPESPATIQNSTIGVTVPDSQVNTPFAMWDGTYQNKLASDYTINLINTTITSNGLILLPDEELNGKVYYSAEVNAKFTNSQILDKKAFNYVDKGYVVATDKNVVLDVKGTVKEVWENGVSVTATQADTKLTVSVKEFGKTAILVKYEDGSYEGFELVVADYAITDQASLKDWNTKRDQQKYTVVGNDFTCDGETTMHAWDKNFTGVLDGMGHTISNAYYSHGGLFTNGRMRPGSVIKNLNFNNLILGTNDFQLFGGGYLEGGLVENVNMTVSHKGLKWTHDWTSLLCHMPTANGDNTFTMKNVKIEYTLIEADRENVAMLYNDAKGYYGTNMENVTIISNGRIAMPGETWHQCKDNSPAITLGKNTKWKNVTITDRDGTQTFNS